MIRINLLGIPKARRGGGKQRPAQVSGGGEGPSTFILIILGLVVVGGAMYYLWTQSNKALADAQKDLAKAVADNLQLADVKAKYEATKKQSDLFKRRVDVIHDLKAKQTGPVELLSLVADQINNTDAVWLEAMTYDGRALDFTGMALSPNAVADLMANLQKTGAFRSVEIKETAQDNTMKDLQAFKFELLCEWSPVLPSAGTTPATPAGTVPAVVKPGQTTPGKKS